MIDGRFALFDSDNGHAILLSEYRRAIIFDGDDERRDDLKRLQGRANG